MAFPHKRTAFISTGDRDWKAEGIPVDSSATIDALFTALRNDFGVTRVLWRGGQDDFMFRHHRHHPENHEYEYGFTKQLRWLRNEVGTSHIAIETAHRLGMAIYLYAAVYQSGGEPNRTFTEDEVRRRYPECVPVNRYSTLRQANGVEFGHAAARRYMAQRWAQAAEDWDYDGICFYTYIDGPFIRYFDEFGYNRSVVDEYRRRHGCDIRYGSFDVEEWGKIRGEYLTAFLAALKRHLSGSGRDLMVLLNPEDTHIPQCHGSEVARRHTTTGRVYIDWENWAANGVVDELAVASKNSTIETITRGMREVMGGIAGTGCRLSVYRPTDSTPLDALSSTVGEVFHVYDRKIESGFGIEHLGMDPDETDDSPDGEGITSHDVRARRRSLYFAARGRKSLPFDRLVGAAQDSDVFVRRRAMEALGASGSAEAAKHIEGGLLDPEHAVRVSAAITLGSVNRPESVIRLEEAVVAEDRSPAFLRRAVVPTLCRIFAADPNALSKWLTHENERVRCVALLALRTLLDEAERELPGRSAAVVRELAANDPHPYNRNLAVQLFYWIKDTPVQREVLLTVIDDPDVTVQAQSAHAVGDLCERLSQADLEPWTVGIQALERKLGEFGMLGRRTDADWGWRAFGEALKRAGPMGLSMLDSMMRQRDDPVLADRAWRILWLPEWNSIHPFEITSESDAEAHRHRPVFGFPPGADRE